MEKYSLEVFCFETEICEESEWIEIEKLGISSDIIKRMSELGIIEIRNNRIGTHQLNRIFKALRLKKSLGINLAGASVILDLLDRMDQLEQELEKLKKA